MKKRTLMTMMSGVVLLSACSAQPEPLPATEVLKRAMIVGQSMQSADINAAVEVTTTGGIWLQGALQGVVRDSGLSLHGTASGSVASQPASFSGVVTIPGTGEAFVRLDELTWPGFSDVPMTWGQWWRSGNRQHSPTTKSVPNEPLIDRQLQALKLRKDFGLEEVQNGFVYHFALEIDAQALQSLQRSAQDASGLAMQLPSGWGEVWINAQTFVLERALWTVQDVPLPKGTANLTLDIQLTHHGKGGDLLLPVGDVGVVGDDSVFATFFSGSLLP